MDNNTNLNTTYIITGLINPQFTLNLCKSYSNIKNKIISTWKDQDITLLKILSDNGFDIILNDYPDVKKSVNFQNKCIYNGCIYAKQLGFTHCIRSRTDIWSLQFHEFMECTEYKYKNKLCCLAMEHSIGECEKKYFFHDTIVSGPVNEMIKFFSNFQNEDDTRSPEIFNQEMYLKKTKLNEDDIRTMINFCANDARKKGILILWFPSKGKFELINDLTQRSWFFCE